MTDSPINFMMNGHTLSYLEQQQLKNQQLKDKLSELISKLNIQKQNNKKHLAQIDNQEQTITVLKQSIKQEQRQRDISNSMNFSKLMTQNNQSNSSIQVGLKYKLSSKSTELPHKRAYLQSHINSTQNSFIDSDILQKKLKMNCPIEIKRVTSYGTFYNKRNFSLNKPRFK